MPYTNIVVGLNSKYSPQNHFGLSVSSARLQMLQEHKHTPKDKAPRFSINVGHLIQRASQSSVTALRRPTQTSGQTQLSFICERSLPQAGAPASVADKLWLLAKINQIKTIAQLDWQRSDGVELRRQRRISATQPRDTDTDTENGNRKRLQENYHE